MTTVSTPRPQLRRTAADPVPVARLIVAEVRKLVDTPAGMALLGTAVLLAGVFGGGGVLFRPENTISSIALMAGLPAATLLPVLAILTVTAERTHRTALITFTLTPRRERVLAAKIIAVTVVALLITPLALLAAVIIAPFGTMITPHQVSWTVDGSEIILFTLSSLLLALSGAALAGTIGNAPAAIVVVLVWPMLSSLLSTAHPALAEVVSWIDLGTVVGAELPPEPGTVARTITAVLAWVLLPGIVGCTRELRREVR